MSWRIARSRAFQRATASRYAFMLTDFRVIREHPTRRVNPSIESKSLRDFAVVRPADATLEFYRWCPKGTRRAAAYSEGFARRGTVSQLGETQ